jgi:hypothetical protein
LLKLGHINVRSLFTGFSELVNIVKDNNLNIVALSETWLTKDTNSQTVSFDGYTLFRKDRQNRGGGVGMYVTSTIRCSTFDVNFINDDTFEYLLLELNLARVRVLIASFYRPPNYNLINFCDNLESLMLNVFPAFDEVICLGDFNVDFSKSPNLLERLFDGYNFLQLINEPTRITENSQTLIDLILVSNINFVTSTKIIHTHNISDHAMVMCETTWELHRTPLRFTTSRSYRDFNYNNFLTDLMNLDWREFLYAKYVNDKVKIFNCMIISLFDIRAPLRTIRITKPKAPWLTEELKALMKQRDKALCVSPGHLYQPIVDYKPT